MAGSLKSKSVQSELSISLFVKNKSCIFYILLTQLYVQKTLNPVWDECFEFAVSLDACRCPGAALALSVWDRDVLTADDFAGEAFVSLARIPGVNNHAAPDPLRPLELPLMQLHDRSQYLLNTKYFIVYAF